MYPQYLPKTSVFCQTVLLAMSNNLIRKFASNLKATFVVVFRRKYGVLP